MEHGGIYLVFILASSRRGRVQPQRQQIFVVLTLMVYEKKILPEDWA